MIYIKFNIFGGGKVNVYIRNYYCFGVKIWNINLDLGILSFKYLGNKN